MSDQLPEFAPLMLSGLSYSEAVKQMRVTGCSVRRPHWCQPVLVIDQDHVMLDDEGEVTPWTPDREDERARDWSMVATLKGS